MSNAMRHGAGVVDINLTGDATVLLLEVGDTSELLPRPRAADDTDVGGRGLALVAGLSTWGVQGRPAAARPCGASSRALSADAAPAIPRHELPGRIVLGVWCFTSSWCVVGLILLRWGSKEVGS